MRMMNKIMVGIFRGLYLSFRALGRTFRTQISWAGYDIGFNSALGGGCSLAGENRIGQNCVISNSSMGRGTYCVNNVLISNSEIGAYTSIGSNVSIGLHSHPTRDYVSTFPGFHYKWTATPYLNKPNQFDVQKRTYIGSDVWIGNSVSIINGVVIGDGAIIGAGAIVNRNVPPYAIVGGVPARIIRYRFTKTQIERLLRIRWWCWPISRIALQQRAFANINNFLEGEDYA